MIGFPTTTTSTTSWRDAPASDTRSPARESSADLTAQVISSAPRSFIMAYETRLIRSSPKRIWGFIAPADASTSPLVRSSRWPAMVVDPTSKASPRIRSWNPGQTAITSRPECTATVTDQSPAVRAAWRPAVTAWSKRRPPSPQSAARASATRSRSDRASSRDGRVTST